MSFLIWTTCPDAPLLPGVGRISNPDYDEQRMRIWGLAPDTSLARRGFSFLLTPPPQTRKAFRNKAGSPENPNRATLLELGKSSARFVVGSEKMRNRLHFAPT